MVEETQEYTADAEEIASNGHSNGRRASQREIGISTDPVGMGFNAPEEIFKGSNEPVEYLPRTRIEPDEVARTSRIVARHNRMTKGYSDLPQVLAWQFNARIGEKGEARKELIRIATNQPERYDRIRGAAGMGARSRDMNKNEIQR